jgi:hypothetical protein
MNRNNLFVSSDEEDFTDSEESSLGINVPQQPLAPTKKWDAFQVRENKQRNIYDDEFAS